MKISYKRGIGPLAIVIIVAIVLLLGGGVYYASHKSHMSDQTQINSSINATTSANVSAQTSNGTLRSLLTLGGNRSMVCAVSQVASSTNGVSGTIYISNGMIRGDFTMNSGSSGTLDSHMIKNGDTVYAWTGTQGAKMTYSAMTAASANSKTNVNLDQKINYKCSVWSVDSSKFTVPTNINFTDVNAALNASAKAGVSIGSQCSACNSLSGNAKTQCLSAMHC